MYFVLDLGGTNFRISWTNSLKKVKVHANILRYKNSGNYEKDSNWIMDIVKSKSKSADGIAIAIPGHFNRKKIVLDYANNLKVWIDKPFFKQVKREFKCDLVVDRDSTLAAIGEGLNNNLYGSRFLYITWGTGIGGCVVTARAKHLPKITTLDWENTFKQVENLCSGGHAIANFGVELKHLNNMQWRVLVDNFVNEIEKICNKINLKFVVLGGGIAAKREDIVSIIQTGLGQRNIKLFKSQLDDFSAIHGGYAILRKSQWCK